VQTVIPAPPAAAPITVLAIGETAVVTRAAGGMLVLGFLPVVPMTIISAGLMIGVSLLTQGSRPGPAVLAKFMLRPVPAADVDADVTARAS
jgi:hypothetical protein